MKNNIYSILISTALCLILTSCWTTRIDKNFSIRNDLGQPVPEAKVYILWTENPYMAPKWMPARKATWADLKTAKELVLESDAEGNIRMNIELYRPSEYDMVVIKKGYYPTLIPVNTKSNTIVLLSQKRYKTILHKSPLGEYEYDVTLVHQGKTFLGVTYKEGMDGLHGYDAGIRLDGWEESKPEKYNKFNFSNIYDSYQEDDGVFLQEKAKQLPYGTHE